MKQDQMRKPLNLKKYINEIHNYMYSNTNILTEDKPLFIIIILVGLKNKIINKSIKDIENKDDLYPLLDLTLKSNNLDLDLYKLINGDDLLHIYNLTLMILNLYEENPDIDLLSEFYSEFIKYGNMDSKSLGIVLTPPHIIKLMCKLINIIDSDTVIDICTGTGSFLIEAHKYNPKMIIGVEYQNKLYSMLKCNSVIRNITNCHYINGDCLNEKNNIIGHKITKALLNPPYGKKSVSEWEFVLKSVNYLENGGELACIIPNSCIFNNSVNNNYKKILLESCDVLNIILCRDTLFYPVANIGTIILHIKKSKSNKYTNIIDFRDDGFVSKVQSGWVKTDLFEERFNDVLTAKNSKLEELTYNKCWYILNMDFDQEDINIECLKSIKYDVMNHKNIIDMKNKSNDSNIKKNINTEFKMYLISDLFKILTKPDIAYEHDKFVYLISAKNNNNGIKDIIKSNKNTFEAPKLVLITGGNGGCGLCFYQNTDFNITSSTKVLSLLDDVNIKFTDNLYVYLSYMLSKNKSQYSRHYAWTNDRILNTKIYIPFKNNEINYTYIDNILNE